MNRLEKYTRLFEVSDQDGKLADSLISFVRENDGTTPPIEVYAQFTGRLIPLMTKMDEIFDLDYADSPTAIVRPDAEDQQGERLLYLTPQLITDLTIETISALGLVKLPDEELPTTFELSRDRTLSLGKRAIIYSIEVHI